jgi:hypothetical protein
MTTDSRVLPESLLKNGFRVYKQGIEYPLMLAAVGAGLAFTGGGTWILCLA